MVEPTVVIEPRDVPAHVVLCYFQDVIERVVREHGGRQVARLRSEIGDNPIYEIDYFSWWGRVESNHLPSGYEPPALTDELHPRQRMNYSRLYAVRAGFCVVAVGLGCVG